MFVRKGSIERPRLHPRFRASLKEFANLFVLIYRDFAIAFESKSLKQIIAILLRIPTCAHSYAEASFSLSVSDKSSLRASAAGPGTAGCGAAWLRLSFL